MRKKKILLVSLVLLAAMGAVTYQCNAVIEAAAAGKLYADAGTIPYNKVGILLGTTKKGRRAGHNNPYYDYRIDAAVALLQAGKIKCLVISGDNGHKNYNEPALMRSDLMARGIDSAVIYLDYAGFRTFDSMVRVKEIFGQQSVTVISQPFHNARAIYTANHEGIAAIGFNAQDVTYARGLKTQIREKLARVKVFLDFWLGIEPKFLGEKINIPA